MTEQSARPAFALVLAILGVTLAGALIVATHIAVSLEHRTAAAGVNRQRAFAASEHGLWSALADWDPAHSTLQRGTASTRVVPAGGDSATVTTVRLSETTYWLLSEASVGAARRRTGVNVRVSADSAGMRARPVRRSWVELH